MPGRERTAYVSGGGRGNWRGNAPGGFGRGRGVGVRGGGPAPPWGAAGGDVVNIASISGKRGLPGMAAYTASKFGMLGLADCLRHEGRPYNIRTTAICPGWVNTAMAAGTDIPAETMVQPEDIAATVLFL